MLKNVKIGKRLVAAFIVVTIITSISGATGLILMLKLDKNYSSALVSNGFVQGDIGNYNTYINKDGATVRDIATMKTALQRRSAQAKLDEIKLKTQEALDRAAVNCTTPEELALMAVISENMPKYNEVRDRAVALAVAGNTDEALSLFRSEAVDYLNACSEAGDQLMALNVELGNKLSTELTAQSRSGLLFMLAVTLAGAAVSLVLAVYIARGISKPIGEIERAAAQMAKGNYDIEIKYKSRDEIGLLANSMTSMMTTTRGIIADTSRGLGEIANGNFDIVPQVEFVGVFEKIQQSIRNIIVRLSDTMEQIKAAADQVSVGSEQVSGGAQALAQGATEQASSVQELSASIAEVADQINQNAANSAAASKLAVTAGENLDASNARMRQMIAAMDDINKSSARISKIIKTIEDIAFQTNILALNAAVEAARAGAAGKGFAVVADEVRNLANKSSEAAKQTNVLIEDSVKSVEKGVKIAQDTAQSLVSVVTGEQEMAKLIQRISLSGNEQSSAITQINLGVEQISSVVQTNSATSQQSAAASEELNGQADVMKQMVGRFKLIDTGRVNENFLKEEMLHQTPEKVKPEKAKPAKVTSKY